MALSKDNERVFGLGLLEVENITDSGGRNLVAPVFIR
jgi:hypothetical protein